MKLVIEIDEDIRIAISRMGLLRIPDDMQKKVDKAIQHGTPIEQEPCEDCISKEKVIDILDYWYDSDSDGYIQAAKSINELPSVQPKVGPCEDAISREWIKIAIHNFYYGLMHTPTEEDIQAYLDVAPSVQQKTGHWECNELFYEGESRGAIIRCSKCGNEFKVSPKVFESLYDNERFCNYCGAKMESEGEE